MALSISYSAIRNESLSVEEREKMQAIISLFSLRNAAAEIPPPVNRFDGEDFVIFGDSSDGEILGGATALPSSVVQRN